MESIAPLDGPYVVCDGKKLLDFSSCDFLGLAQHPEVKKGAIKYALKYGVGTPPPGITSTSQLEIETKLAHYLGKEQALLFSSESELHSQLEKLGATLFSAETEEGKKGKGGKVADETYLLGTKGTTGFATSGTELVGGSFMCGSGAFLAGPKKQLASLTPGALSFPTLGALDSALILIPEMEEERKMIIKHKAWLVKQLEGFSLTELRSPRVVITSKETAQIRQFLLQEHIYLAPTNKDQTLYFSMTALHTPDDLDQLSVALKKLSATNPALSTQSFTPTP